VGVSIRNKSLDLERQWLETTEIRFNNYSDEDMVSYVNSLDTFNTTAGVKSESDLFPPLVQEIIADDEYAIIGLPIKWILDQLNELI
jgi:predicted house-cleaning NTP pyrophosphatase (Maf/HAM1 superfamily)